MRIFAKIVFALFGIYLLLCASLYYKQESIIFLPEKLNKDYVFQFERNFKEFNFKTENGITLNALLFKADSSKGLIFYLHGNAGSVKGWGNIAAKCTAFNQDVLMLDYRGYGKSTGKITSEEQIYTDVQQVYNEMKKIYPEDKITVLGYSVGTGPASWLASRNHPKRLILQAPYYSLTRVMERSYPGIPLFLLKYKIPTFEYLKQCKVPVTIFHGDRDAVIAYDNSLLLQKEFKKGDTLITLKGKGHIGITDVYEYSENMDIILNSE